MILKTVIIYHDDYILLVSMMPYVVEIAINSAMLSALQMTPLVTVFHFN